MDKTCVDVFFELVRAGLWGTEAQLASYGEVDYSAVLEQATDQSLIGLVAAGLEQVKDVKVPQTSVLQLIGQTLQIEQRNKAMNAFIALLIERMRAAGIYTLLVKGQGIAQCYDKPLWRSSGDVDLFLSADNYIKAKDCLLPLASSVEEEYVREKHLGLNIDGWIVELHGHLYCGLSSKVEKELDALQQDTFCGGQVRSWMNGKCQVFLLKAENDAFYVFSHILQHFYKGGIGLRQICDWCRLLWTYRDSLNDKLLEQRIKRSGLMSEWQAFGAFAVDYLGMPADAMPFYSSDKKWSRKAKRICSFVMEVGNFGHNRDNTYYDKPFIVRKFKSFGRRCGDLARHARIFPLDSLRFFPNILFNGLRSAARGE